MRLVSFFRSWVSCTQYLTHGTWPEAVRVSLYPRDTENPWRKTTRKILVKRACQAQAHQCSLGNVAGLVR